jgi:hypothetical protein
VHFHHLRLRTGADVVAFLFTRGIRAGVVSAEQSLWRRVRLANRALVCMPTTGHGEILVTVSQASYDALSASLRRRATNVVHGVDLTSWTF